MFDENTDKDFINFYEKIKKNIKHSNDTKYNPNNHFNMKISPIANTKLLPISKSNNSLQKELIDKSENS